MTYPYFWRVRTRLPHRFGQHLRVVVRAGMNSALIEFDDGTRVVTSRNYFRKHTSRQWYEKRMATALEEV